MKKSPVTVDFMSLVPLPLAFCSNHFALLDTLSRLDRAGVGIGMKGLSTMERVFTLVSSEGEVEGTWLRVDWAKRKSGGQGWSTPLHRGIVPGASQTCVPGHFRSKLNLQS